MIVAVRCSLERKESKIKTIIQNKTIEYSPIIYGEGFVSSNLYFSRYNRIGSSLLSSDGVFFLLSDAADLMDTGRFIGSIQIKQGICRR